MPRASDPAVDRENHPEGVYPAVCCDVSDVEVKKGSFGNYEAIKIGWQTGEIDSKGRPFTIMREFGFSLGKKSNLRPFLEAWRGRKFTKDELKGFELEVLVGKQCQVQIMHEERDEVTYANVVGILPAPKNSPKVEVSSDYTRWKDREPSKKSGHDQMDEAFGGSEEGDDSVPF